MESLGMKMMEAAKKYIVHMIWYGWIRCANRYPIRIPNNMNCIRFSNQFEGRTRKGPIYLSKSKQGKWMIVGPFSKLTKSE